MTIYEVWYKVPGEPKPEFVDAYLLLEEAQKHKDHLDNDNLIKLVNANVYILPITIKASFEPK